MDWKKNESYREEQEYWEEARRPSIWDRIKQFVFRFIFRKKQPFS